MVILSTFSSSTVRGVRVLYSGLLREETIDQVKEVRVNLEWKLTKNDLWLMDKSYDNDK